MASEDFSDSTPCSYLYAVGSISIFSGLMTLACMVGEVCLGGMAWMELGRVVTVVSSVAVCEARHVRARSRHTDYGGAGAPWCHDARVVECIRGRDLTYASGKSERRRATDCWLLLLAQTWRRGVVFLVVMLHAPSPLWWRLGRYARRPKGRRQSLARQSPDVPRRKSRHDTVAREPFGLHVCVPGYAQLAQHMVPAGTAHLDRQDREQQA